MSRKYEIGEVGQFDFGGLLKQFLPSGPGGGMPHLPHLPGLPNLPGMPGMQARGGERGREVRHEKQREERREERREEYRDGDFDDDQARYNDVDQSMDGVDGRGGGGGGGRGGSGRGAHKHHHKQSPPDDGGAGGGGGGGGGDDSGSDDGAESAVSGNVGDDPAMLPEGAMPNDPRVVPAVGTLLSRICTALGALALTELMIHRAAIHAPVSQALAHPRQRHFFQQCLAYLGLLHAPFAENQIDAPTVAAANEWIERPFARRYFPLGPMTAHESFVRPWQQGVVLEAMLRGWLMPDFTHAEAALLPPTVNDRLPASQHHVVAETPLEYVPSVTATEVPPTPAPSAPEPTPPPPIVPSGPTASARMPVSRVLINGVCGFSGR